jgi:hypothetical protein
MFGHGQIEGFSEKYGMEYRRAYWDERPDLRLAERHEREIAPLLDRRAIFAHVDDFLLFDFVADDGSVNEDVFAYSNGTGGDRSLSSTTATAQPGGSATRWRTRAVGRGAEPRLRRRTLADGLGIRVDGGRS